MVPPTNFAPKLIDLNNMDETPTFDAINDLSSYSKITSNISQESEN